MNRLGYSRYVAQGGDGGSAVTDTMALQAPAGLVGIHLNFLRRPPLDVAAAASFCDIAGVAEAVHQLRSGLRRAAWVPADRRRLFREAVAGQGRHHQVERVLGASAVRS